MARGDSFDVSVVTPEGAILSCKATSATFPAYDGEVGVLPHHAPLLSKVGVGILKVVEADTVHRLYVEGGFAQVADNKLTVLTEQASLPDELSAARVDELLQAARTIKATGDELKFEARDLAFERARVQRRLTR